MSPVKKILLVDADEGIRKSLSLFFEYGNYLVDTYTNAEESLRAFRKDKYDIVFFEEFLQDMDGLKFAKRISDNDECVKVVISLYGHGAQCETKFKPYADFVLTKPISSEDIVGIVDKMKSLKVKGPEVSG